MLLRLRVMDTCEHGNGQLDSIKIVNVFNLLSNCQLFKKALCYEVGHFGNKFRSVVVTFPMLNDDCC